MECKIKNIIVQECIAHKKKKYPHRIIEGLKTNGLNIKYQNTVEDNVA